MYSVARAGVDDEANKGKPTAVKSAQQPAPPSATFGSMRVDSLFTSERLAPWGVLAVALFTRFYRLSEPRGVGA